MEQVRTLGIIQARMGSTRLPNKMAIKLGGVPILQWVIERSKRSSLIDKMVLATSTKKIDDSLARMARQSAILCHRGSESDLLSRFIDTVKHHPADNIVRICADNPFIDPGELDRLVDGFDCNQYDYAFNHQSRLDSKYADGFGAEIFSIRTLERLNNEATLTKHREHVTLKIWEERQRFKIQVLKAPLNLAHPDLRFDIDTLEDLNHLSKLVERGVNISSIASEIVRLECSLQTNESYGTLP